MIEQANASATVPDQEPAMHLSRNQADVIAPGVWITCLLVLGFFARPVLVRGVVIGTFVLGIFYAARDADFHE
jgi:hypothetical protein